MHILDGAQTVKDVPAMWETWIQPLGWDDPTGGGNGNPLQQSCLESYTARGAWRATVHGVTESWTWLSG